LARLPLSQTLSQLEGDGLARGGLNALRARKHSRQKVGIARNI
jgi:hypothetical protein